MVANIFKDFEAPSQKFLATPLQQNHKRAHYFKGRKCLRKKLLRFLQFLVTLQNFIPAKSKTNRELQKFFPAKRSIFAEPRKLIPVKCLFLKENTMNTSSQ